MAQKYVSLPNDKTPHIYAESEFTLCGIPVPINAGASWTEEEPAKVCAACTTVRKTSEKAAKKSTISSTSDLGDISAANAPAPDDGSAA